MTNDIVTRLRELANMGGFLVTVETMFQAADEIERLRKLGNQLAYWAGREDGAQQLISAAHAWKDAQ